MKLRLLLLIALAAVLGVALGFRGGGAPPPESDGASSEAGEPSPESGPRLRGTPLRDGVEEPTSSSEWVGRSGASSIAGVLLGPDGRGEADAVLAARQADVRRVVRTDDEGRFRFEGLASGSWALEVGDPHEHRMRRLDTVQAGTEGLVFRLEKPLRGRLRLHVVGPDGLPVPHFDVAIARRGGGAIPSDATSPVYVRTDGAPVWVQVSRARSASGEPLPYAPRSWGPILAEPGERTLRLEPAARLWGRVVGPEGAPVPRIEVFALPLDRGPATGRGGGFQEHVRTDAEGRFAFRGLAWVPYKLFVSSRPPFAHALPVVAEAGAEVLLRLEHGTTAEVQVVDAEGRPVAGSALSVWRGLGFTNAVTDAEGVARIDRILPGQVYRLRMAPPASRDDLPLVLRDAWGPRETVLAFPPGRRLEGRVVTDEGAPVEGAKVTAVDRLDWHHTEQTSASGTFAFGGLPAGSVRVRAQHGDDLSAVVEAGAGDAEVEIPLAASTELSVVVADWPAGAEGATAYLRMEAHAGGDRTARLSSEGRARFLRVDPRGTYAFYAAVTQGEAASVAWAAAVRGDAEEVRLRVRPGSVIEGTVTWPRDLPRPLVEIQELGRVTRTLVDADGRFRLTGLPEGTWTVEVESRDFGGRRTAHRTVRTGSSVHLDLGS